MSRPSWVACLTGAILLGLAGQSPVRADDLVKLVVPYAGGGFPDTISRLVTSQIAMDGHSKFIVENRPGGAGAVAAEYVARATPDGNTLLVADAQQWAIAPQMLKSVRYDVMRDFAPVTLLGTTGNVLVVNDSLGVNDFRGLIDLLKANPGKYYYGTPGVGTLHHLTIEALKNRLGLQVTDVPYKGAGELIPGLLSNNVQFAILALPAVSAFAKEGKLKILARATAKRSALMPDIPTIEEFGVPDMDFPGAIGILAPAGTPQEKISSMASAMSAAVSAPEVTAKLTVFAIEPARLTPAEFKKFIEADIAKFGTAIKNAGIVMQ